MLFWNVYHYSKLINVVQTSLKMITFLPYNKIVIKWLNSFRNECSRNIVLALSLISSWRFFNLKVTFQILKHSCALTPLSSFKSYILCSLHESDFQDFSTNNFLLMYITKLSHTPYLLHDFYLHLVKLWIL